MGIENRDYVRDEGRQYSGGTFLAEYPALRNIIVITVIVYLLQIFVTSPARDSELPDHVQSYRETHPELFEEYRQAWHETDQPQISVVQNWLQLDTQKVVFQGQVWRLLTSAFCHERFGIWHLLINMLLLYWFGREIETIYGSKAFTWFYVTAAIAASVAFVLLQLYTGEINPAIGASGAVMAVLMVYAIYHPRDEIRVFFLFPVQIRFLVALYVLYDLHPLLLKIAGTPSPTGIAHASHLGGLAYGYVFYRTGFCLLSIWEWIRGKFSKSNQNVNRSNRRPTRNRPSPKSNRSANSKQSANSRRNVDQPASAEKDQLDLDVDRILEKISQQGRESLTEAELGTLEIASRKYSQRANE